MVWDCGAGHSFFSGISCRLLICVFPFPLAKAKFIGERKKNRQNHGKLLIALRLLELLVFVIPIGHLLLDCLFKMYFHCFDGRLCF